MWELERQTGIPVVVLDYGDLSSHRQEFYSALRTMALVMDRQRRAEEVIDFFDAAIADLEVLEILVRRWKPVAFDHELPLFRPHHRGHAPGRTGRSRFGRSGLRLGRVDGCDSRGPVCPGAVTELLVPHRLRWVA